MARDTREYVAACTTCAQVRRTGGTYSLVAGSDHCPSPVNPGLEIALDFVTSLPVSQINLVILTIVDSFSRAAHFVALPKLPSAFESARLLI